MMFIKLTNFHMSGLIVIIIIMFFSYILQKNNVLLFAKNSCQHIFEQGYYFILDVVKQNIGYKGILYFPIIFNVFYIIYILNIGGLAGYNLQLSSHIFVTFTISISLFLGIILLGVIILEKKFINQFIPKDSPRILFPLLVVIETTSYLIRPFTLGIRLFANMFSGHVLLFVIISFVIVIIEKKLFMLKLIILIFPLFLLSFIMCLELLIMFLQAYVFIILLCVYLNDSLNSH